MPNEGELVKASVEALLQPITDLISKLAGPAAEEIGLTLKDSIRVYRVKRQLALLRKVEEAIRVGGFAPQEVPLKVLLPIMDNASVESEEDLHTAWAALLANAADPSFSRRVLPSFVEILKQLSRNEAVFLAAVHTHVLHVLRKHLSKPQKDGSWPELVDLGRHGTLLQRYAECGLTRKHASVLNNYQMNQKYPDQDVVNDYREFNLVLDNLIRLGVLVRKARGEHAHYHVTRLGYEFVTACRLPGANNNSQRQTGSLS